MTRNSPISYGRLAMEIGYVLDDNAVDLRSVLSWLEGQEMHHIDERQWLQFVSAFKLSVNLEPGTICDAETAKAIRAAAALDPGAEEPVDVQEQINDLTANAMDAIYKDAMQVLTAALGIGQGGAVLASQTTIEGVVDALMGRIAPKLRAAARAAYEMNRAR